MAGKSKLDDYFFDDDERFQIEAEQSIKLARARHTDFDEVLKGRDSADAWTEKQLEDIEKSGDLGEAMYQHAKADRDPFEITFGKEDEPFIPDDDVFGSRSLDADGRKAQSDDGRDEGPTRLSTITDVLEE